MVVSFASPVPTRSTGSVGKASPQFLKRGGTAGFLRSCLLALLYVLTAPSTRLLPRHKSITVSQRPFYDYASLPWDSHRTLFVSSITVVLCTVLFPRSFWKFLPLLCFCIFAFLVIFPPFLLSFSIPTCISFFPVHFVILSEPCQCVCCLPAKLLGECTCPNRAVLRQPTRNLPSHHYFRKAFTHEAWAGTCKGLPGIGIRL